MSSNRRSILGGVIGLGLSLGLRRRAVAQEAVSYTYDALGRGHLRAIKRGNPPFDEV